MSSATLLPNVPTKVLAGPDGFDRVLGWGSLILLAMAITAVARGSAGWAHIAWQVWIHLATIAVVLALTPAILWQKRGTGQHRLLGYVWIVAMGITGALTFDIRLINRGQFSPIHLLSALTLIVLVRVVLTARARNLRSHRQSVRQLSLGGLLIAGFFTFPFDRLLGHWLFS